MLRHRATILTFLVALLLAAAVLGQAGCDSSRDRPTGLGSPLPPTSVTVVEPQTNKMVPADSIETIVIQATGSLVAVEFFLKRSSLPDTLARDRRDFGRTQESIEVEFDVRIPDLVTGTHLVIRGVAEDLAGELHFSEPVVVQVIECDLFPTACE